MLRKNVKIDLLRRTPLFSDCSKSQLAELSTIADEIDFPAGRTLIQEGERGRQLFVVIEGTVEVRKKGRKVALRGGNEIFGEMALITNAPSNATVTTTSPVRALVIVDRNFRGLLERTPAVQSRILLSLAARVAPDAI